MKKIIAVITLFFIIVGSVVYAEEQKKPMSNQSITIYKPNHSKYIVRWYFIIQQGISGNAVQKVGPFNDLKSCNNIKIWLKKKTIDSSDCWFVYE